MQLVRHLFTYLLLFRLVRFPNLVVVALTLFLVAYCVVNPALLANGITPALYWHKFLEVSVIILIITASGYIINDLQDREIDEINRPGTNPVKELTPEFTYWFYGFVVLVGFLVSTVAAFRLNERHLLWLYPAHISILAIYSVYFKRKPLLGNLLVALYCGGVPAVILIAERTGLRQLSVADPTLHAESLNICYLFMSFAFLGTLLRELVKDLEDYRGDKVMGRKTVPVLFGIPTARKIALILVALVITAILIPLLFAWTAFSAPALVASILALAAFLVAIGWQIYRAAEKAQYHRISLQLKLMLLAGLLLLVFF